MFYVCQLIYIVYILKEKIKFRKQAIPHFVS